MDDDEQKRTAQAVTTSSSFLISILERVPQRTSQCPPTTVSPEMQSSIDLNLVSNQKKKQMQQHVLCVCVMICAREVFLPPSFVKCNVRSSIKRRWPCLNIEEVVKRGEVFRIVTSCAASTKSKTHKTVECEARMRRQVS